MKTIHIKSIILFILSLIAITILLSINSTAEDAIRVGVRSIEPTALEKGQIFARPQQVKKRSVHKPSLVPSKMPLLC